MPLEEFGESLVHDKRIDVQALLEEYAEISVAGKALRRYRSAAADIRGKNDVVMRGAVCSRVPDDVYRTFGRSSQFFDQLLSDGILRALYKELSDRNRLVHARYPPTPL